MLIFESKLDKIQTSRVHSISVTYRNHMRKAEIRYQSSEFPNIHITL